MKYVIQNFIHEETYPIRSEMSSEEEYDVRMARYCLSTGLTSKREKFIDSGLTNIEFFKGNQWIKEEDIELFLKDTHDNPKNRIKVVQNKFIPIVAQYIGNAKNLSIDYKLIDVSGEAQTRKEIAMNKLIFMIGLSDQLDPAFKMYLQNNFPIKDNLEETLAAWDEHYTDKFADAVSLLDKIVSEDNNLDDKREVTAFNLSTTGLCGFMCEEYNGDYTIEPIDPFEVVYDPNCKLKDFSDAIFVGLARYKSYSYMAEKYNLSSEQLQALKEAELSRKPEERTGMCPEVIMYWKDTEMYRYGWVYDQFGDPMLVEITLDGLYTEKDIVPESELSEDQLSIFNGSNNGILKPEVVRYCRFIPNEFVSSRLYTDTQKPYNDIVLEHGILKYQDIEIVRKYNSKFPIKLSAWYLIDGEIFTPLSSLVNPQRMINRMSSVIENIINTTLPKNVVYDSMIVEDEAEFLKNFYEGKPNKIDSRGLGVHNMVSAVGGGIDSTVGFLNEMMEVQSRLMDRMIGVNESLRGETQGANKLVGVTAMEIQRASLAQEGFYGSIVSVYKEIHESIANVGRRIYVKFGNRLKSMVGEKAARVLLIAGDNNTDYYRCFIKRVTNPEQIKMSVQQQLLQMVSAQIISKHLLAEHWNNADENTIGNVLKEQVVMDIEVGKMQQAQQEEQMRKEEYERQVAESREDALIQHNTEKELAKEQIKQARKNNE